jgi:hypothetical protein
MSTVDGQGAPGGSPNIEPADLKLEAIVLPVADADRSTSFSTAGDLAAALHRAESAHAEHEKRIGRADSDWSDWYAEYMVREQSGEEIPV